VTQERLAGFKRYARAAQPSPERVPQIMHAFQDTRLKR
jgi:hypothetical protein